MTDTTTPTPAPIPDNHLPDYETVSEALQELYDSLGEFAAAFDKFKTIHTSTNIDFTTMLQRLQFFMLDIEQDITDTYAHELFKYGFEDDEDEDEDEDEDDEDEDEEYEDEDETE